MSHPIHDQYRQAEILPSDPLKQVQVLYRAAIDSVSAARRFVQEKKIRERSSSIMKAWAIVNELLLSLNHEVGGELSRNLAGLYTYMQTRLLEANIQQTEPPLAEVEKLLTTLLEGWTSATLPAAAAQAAGTASSISTDSGDAHTKEYVPLNCSY
jgi:flagellar secretion chaperone FliS